MFAITSRCRNSIGSSIVMMLTRRFWLTWLIIAASAVDLPEPVTPVTSTRPRGLSAISSSTVGQVAARGSSSPRRESPGRRTPACRAADRCWCGSGPTPGTPIAKSASFFSANSFTCRGVMICSARSFRSSGLSGGMSSAVSSPLTRMVGGRPTLSSRSEPLRCTIWAIACLKLNDGVDGVAARSAHPLGSTRKRTWPNSTG